jgi:hypothetical protein
MGQEPDKKKPNFFRRLKDAFNGISRKDWMPIAKETLKDLKRPQEIGLLVGCTFLPGGWIGYGVYRIAKYRLKKASNDNQENPGKEAKPKPPKPPKP